MSVIVTMRVSADPARFGALGDTRRPCETACKRAFEETVAANVEAIGRITGVAKRNVLTA